jgi:hypothetical protein
MSWHLECRENSEVILQPIVYSDVAHFLKKQYSFKNAEHSVKNNISTFVRLPISFYNGRMEEFLLLVFNYVVYIDYYERSLCWQFHNFYKHDCVLPYYVCTWCNQMQCSQMCVSFLSRSFPTLIESILGKIQMITPHQIIFI